MNDNEQVVLIASPKIALEMLERDETMNEMMVICMFAPDDAVLVAKHEDWVKMVDNAEVFERGN